MKILFFMMSTLVLSSNSISLSQVSQPITEVKKASCQATVNCNDCMTHTDWVDTQGLLLPTKVWAIKCTNDQTFTVAPNFGICVYDLTAGSTCTPLPYTFWELRSHPGYCEGCKGKICWDADTDTGIPEACSCTELNLTMWEVDVCGTGGGGGPM